MYFNFIDSKQETIMRRFSTKACCISPVIGLPGYLLFPVVFSELPTDYQLSVAHLGYEGILVFKKCRSMSRIFILRKIRTDNMN